MKQDFCGIVMPVVEPDEVDATHWNLVKSILSETVLSVPLNPRMISISNENKSIDPNSVKNIFRDRLVICDISQTRPHVMLEPGMRLAFNKPVIIVKDDNTKFSYLNRFIEHIEYPKDLSFHGIRKFMNDLKSQIRSIDNITNKNANYSQFLKFFQPLNYQRPEIKEVPAQELPKLNTFINNDGEIIDQDILNNMIISPDENGTITYSVKNQDHTAENISGLTKFDRMQISEYLNSVKNK